MKALWIGVAEVLTDANLGEGNSRAFTNVVAWAESDAEYAKVVRVVFEKYGWDVLGFERVHPVAEQSGYQDEIAQIIDRARVNPNACIYSTLHYYPSKPD